MQSLPVPTIYGIATAASVQLAEAVMGATFPSLLKQIYLEVANGGFGPGAGLLGVAGGYPDSDGRTAEAKYEWFLGQGWRRQLLPAFDWGDGSWSGIDLSTPSGQIITAEAKGFTQTRFDLSSWFSEWLAGTDLHSEIYEIEQAVITNPFTHKPMTVRRRGRAKGKLVEEREP